MHARYTSERAFPECYVLRIPIDAVHNCSADVFSLCDEFEALECCEIIGRFWNRLPTTTLAFFPCRLRVGCLGNRCLLITSTLIC